MSREEAIKLIDSYLRNHKWCADFEYWKKIKEKLEKEE